MRAIALIALLAFPAAAQAPVDADLAAGMRAVREGDFESAVLTLDGVARRLAGQGDHAADLAQASFHLGVAYLGLGQETLARAKFRQALAQDPKLDPSPQEFSQRVLRVFRETKHDFETGKAIERLARRTPGKTPWLLLGGGGAGAVVLAVVLSGERKNTAPTASFTVEPQGAAIVGVTDVIFRASATDAEGDPLRYEWDFGDGSTALGNIVSHRYEQEGEKTVKLRVGDGLAVAEVTGRVSVGSLTGFWRLSSRQVDGVIGFEISNPGPGPVVRLATDKWVFDKCQATSLIAPNHFGLSCGLRRVAGSLDYASLTFVGEVDASLRRISGTMQCEGHISWGATQVCGLPPAQAVQQLRDDRIVAWPEVLVRE